ncbi:MAG: hypothetical protein EA339_03090 [Rhodobacteraceae bacterium]|nr:MAG: hypothetical protein EA339_03090 [Paracoccaceae bacterium]
MHGAHPLNPAQATTTAIRTIMADAVHQASNADAPEKTVPKVLTTQQDKRSRLIGPPPTFQVNLLQHLQETRMDPEVQMPLEADMDHPEMTGSKEDTDAEAPIKLPDSAYESYVKMRGDAEALVSPEVNKSV